MRRQIAINLRHC